MWLNTFCRVTVWNPPPYPPCHMLCESQQLSLWWGLVGNLLKFRFFPVYGKCQIHCQVLLQKSHTENWFQFAGTPPWLSPGPFAFHHCQEERGAPTPADGNRRAARSESSFGNPTLVKNQPISGQICAGFLVGFSNISWFPSRIPTTPLIQK